MLAAHLVERLRPVCTRCPDPPRKKALNISIAWPVIEGVLNETVGSLLFQNREGWAYDIYVSGNKFFAVVVDMHKLPNSQRSLENPMCGWGFKAYAGTVRKSSLEALLAGYPPQNSGGCCVRREGLRDRVPARDAQGSWVILAPDGTPARQVLVGDEIDRFNRPEGYHPSVLGGAPLERVGEAGSLSLMHESVSEGDTASVGGESGDAGVPAVGHFNVLGTENHGNFDFPPIPPDDDPFMAPPLPIQAPPLTNDPHQMIDYPFVGGNGLPIQAPPLTNDPHQMIDYPFVGGNGLPIQAPPLTNDPHQMIDYPFVGGNGLPIQAPPLTNDPHQMIDYPFVGGNGLPIQAPPLTNDPHQMIDYPFVGGNGLPIQAPPSTSDPWTGDLFSMDASSLSG
uniref:Uncharacterized protein n=1 Tax=Chromera velia CCMP2878 TaxID=1169474 RepID=A0A0G4GN57_9ALVE|eukprot:Cvel_22636.t1-p1 / transcript=Cvel_22636.t1 / gene=Cvel_22636 / organism=Chromera_velia_CCMP2878 / gene_product=Basic salivary proline-rich protein 4, putative / transcript_product=Basic salivary proline-rich protein 4, putative / location=Cvel_scaffold2246:1423-3289(+) / protein_length=394 / sequence_SO=supercontig / SO=protein_coding / is_pseudo=false